MRFATPISKARTLGLLPSGSYVRNPPTSRHTPGSAAGCVLFVKLWQFDLQDRTPVRRDAPGLVYAQARGRPGVEIAALFHDSREDARMERWQPNASVALDLPEGGEFLVIEGIFNESGEGFEPQPWLRLQPRERLIATAVTGLHPHSGGTGASGDHGWS